MSNRTARSMASASPSKPAFSTPHRLAVVPHWRASPLAGSALYSSPRLTLSGTRPWNQSLRNFLWGTSAIPHSFSVS